MAPINDSSTNDRTDGAHAGFDARSAAEGGSSEETILVNLVTDDTIQATVPEVDETMLFPLPAPSYDEEHGSGVGGQYDQDFSRLDHAYQNPRKEREIPIPHIADEDGAGYRVPGEGRSRSRWRPLLAFLLVAAMVAGIFAAATYGLEAWGGKTVPDVKGISEVRARAMLEDAGFVPEVKTKIADDKIGFVLEQDPESGGRLGEGSTVTIVVAVSRTMPDVMGLPQAEAQDLLGKAGASTIVVETRSSSEAEGTVIAVDPGVGEAFSSYQTVTLTVASKAEVPDVVGKEKVEAQAAVEAAGFKVDIQYIQSEQTYNTVVKTDPEAGTKADPGSTVHVYLAERMPSDPLHLMEYFGKNSASLAKYLNSQGFTLTWASSTDGKAEVTYEGDKGLLMFVERSYYNLYPAHGDTEADSLAAGMPFSAIRWELASGQLPSGASDLSDEATKELMKRCGLANVKDVCTQNDIKMPSGVSKSDAKFRCTYGESSGCSWSVLLVNEGGSTRAVVTCAPTTYYQRFDLSQYGGSPCDLIACGDVYDGV